MRMLLSSVLAAQLVLLAGSAHVPVSPREPSSVPDARALSPSISDGALGGTDGFYFLPPLVEDLEFDGTFDPDRAPTVEICELTDAGCDPAIATFTRQTGPGSETVRVDTAAEHYVVDWHTDAFELTEDQVYRIRVLLEGREAGHVDVEPVSSGKMMQNAESSETFPLTDGKTLPIKFWIEEGLDVSDRVPAVTPDGVPRSIYADADMQRGMLLDIVMVVFAPGSKQEARQAAVDKVNGTVVGGKRIFGDDGIYFVEIDHDGTTGPLWAAIHLLRTLSQVEMAAPEFVGNFNLHSTPGDGSGLEEVERSHRPATASRDRWALERIAGSLAWGCKTRYSETSTCQTPQRL